MIRNPFDGGFLLDVSRSELEVDFDVERLSIAPVLTRIRTQSSLPLVSPQFRCTVMGNDDEPINTAKPVNIDPRWYVVSRD